MQISLTDVVVDDDSLGEEILRLAGGDYARVESFSSGNSANGEGKGLKEIKPK